MTDALVEHPFDCPYCGAPITMLLDLTVPAQEYVEDCEVCCSPIRLLFRVEGDELVLFDAERLE